MPTKRRAGKSYSRGRFPEFCERQLIEGPDLMLAGVGYFDCVASKPACLDQCEPGEREIILDAMRFDWQRMGARILATHDKSVWALREFGPPA